MPAIPRGNVVRAATQEVVGESGRAISAVIEAGQFQASANLARQTSIDIAWEEVETRPKPLRRRREQYSLRMWSKISQFVHIQNS